MKIPQILVGTALPKLLANISGDADTVDGEHAADLGPHITLYTDSSTTLHTFTKREYTDVPDVTLDVSVTSGDIVVASFDFHFFCDTARGSAAAFKLDLGGNVSQARVVCMPVANYYMPATIIWAATASSTTTWTIKAQCYVYNAGDTIYMRYEEMVVLRIRP